LSTDRLSDEDKSVSNAKGNDQEDSG